MEADERRRRLARRLHRRLRHLLRGDHRPFEPRRAQQLPPRQLRGARLQPLARRRLRAADRGRPTALRESLPDAADRETRPAEIYPFKLWTTLLGVPTTRTLAETRTAACDRLPNCTTPTGQTGAQPAYFWGACAVSDTPDDYTLGVVLALLTLVPVALGFAAHALALPRPRPRKDVHDVEGQEGRARTPVVRRATVRQELLLRGAAAGVAVGARALHHPPLPRAHHAVRQQHARAALARLGRVGGGAQPALQRLALPQDDGAQAQPLGLAADVGARGLRGARGRRGRLVLRQEQPVGLRAHGHPLRRRRGAHLLRPHLPRLLEGGREREGLRGQAPVPPARRAARRGADAHALRARPQRVRG